MRAQSTAAEMIEPQLSIAHVNGRDTGGGTDSAARELHHELIRQGCRSQLIVGEKVTDDPTVVQLPDSKGIPGFKRLSLKLEHHLGWQYVYSPKFRKLQDRFIGDVDVVHLHSLHGVGGYADLGHLPTLAKRWPLVLSLQDMWMLTGHCGYGTGCDRWKTGCGECPSLDLYPAISADGTRWNWRRKKRVISGCPGIQVTACSQWLADEAKRSPIFEDTEIHTVHNAIDLDTFSIADKVAARQRAGLPEDKFLVLLCAMTLINVWKGAKFGIDVLNRLALPDLHAVMVGRSGSDAEQQLQCPATVLPYQSDRNALADIYRSADVLLMPSIEEAFGLVAAEAMACGTPVVAFAAGGLPEVVAEDCGIVVESKDTEALISAISTLAADRDRCRQMGKSAAKSVLQRFSINAQAESFQRIYELAIQRRSARTR